MGHEEYISFGLATLINQIGISSASKLIDELEVYKPMSNKGDNQDSIEFLHRECTHFLRKNAIRNEQNGYSRTFFISPLKDIDNPCFYFSLGLSIISLEHLSKSQKKKMTRQKTNKLERNKFMIPVILLGQFARLKSDHKIDSITAYNIVTEAVKAGRFYFGGILLNIDTTDALAKNFYQDKLHLNLVTNSLISEEVEEIGLKSYLIRL